MKKLFLIAMALCYVGIASAQVNKIVVNTSGDVKIRQAQAFEVIPEQTRPNTALEYEITDSTLYLNGKNDFNVAVQELNHLVVNSRGDVVTEGTINGGYLMVEFNSSGDSKLDLNYDKIFVIMNGNGDLVLRGFCDALEVVGDGRGDLDAHGLRVEHYSNSNLAGLSDLLYELGINLEKLTDSVDWDTFERDMERWGESMEEWGRHMEEWGEDFERRMEGRAPHEPRDRQKGDRKGWDKPHYGPTPKELPADHFPGQRPMEKHERRSLLFDPHWCGFDAGLNMLLTPGLDDPSTDYAFLDLKPLKSWNFNFNIADVGIAFSRSHVAGLYTGIGLGWNNYSFTNPVRLVRGDQHIEADWVDETVEGRVKKSKLGVLYAQMPLMVEVRPTPNFFIAAGVTGGLRIDTWSKIKFMDKYKEKVHNNYYVSPLKLDATLRAGGDDMGFFASYNLLPLFREGCGPDAHTFNVGFTLLF